MGNFLPAPITEKHTQRGEGNGVTFALSSMQGWRMTMEDSHVTALAPTGLPPGVSVFAVFDGHGGQLTAQLAAEELTSHFAKTMKASAVFNGKDGEADPAKIGDAMNDAYMALDEYIKDVHTREYGDDQSGCTAISALLTSTHIIVANSGDSRSVLATNRSTTIEMSYDHKPVNPGERARIERAGGVVRSNRVNGDLAVSRALGDFSYKDRPDMKAEEQKVSAKPDIKVHKLDGTEEFLVLACDGIWDVMTNEELCAYVRKLMRDGETDLGLVAEEVIDYCLRAGSRDNMSIIVVKFPNAEVGEGGGVKAIRAERERLDAEAKAAGEGEVDDDLTQAGLTFTPAKSS